MRFLMRSYRPSRIETKTTNNADDNGFESKRIALKMFQDRLKWKLLKTVSLYFGRVTADDGRKRIKKSIGFEWMKTRQWRPGENKTLVWVKLFSFVLVAAETDIFQKPISLVEALMWMKGWISDLEHCEVRPSYTYLTATFEIKQHSSGLIRTRNNVGARFAEF